VAKLYGRIRFGREGHFGRENIETENGKRVGREPSMNV